MLKVTLFINSGVMVKLYHMIKKQDHLGIPNLALISNERTGFEWRKREMRDHSEETWLEFGF